MICMVFWPHSCSWSIGCSARDATASPTRTQGSLKGLQRASVMGLARQFPAPGQEPAACPDRESPRHAASATPHESSPTELNSAC